MALDGRTGLQTDIRVEDEAHYADAPPPLPPFVTQGVSRDGSMGAPPLLGRYVAGSGVTPTFTVTARPVGVRERPAPTARVAYTVSVNGGKLSPDDRAAVELPAGDAYVPSHVLAPSNGARVRLEGQSASETMIVLPDDSVVRGISIHSVTLRGRGLEVIDCELRDVGFANRDTTVSGSRLHGESSGRISLLADSTVHGVVHARNVLESVVSGSAELHVAGRLTNSQIRGLAVFDGEVIATGNTVNEGTLRFGSGRGHQLLIAGNLFRQTQAGSPPAIEIDAAGNSRVFDVLIEGNSFLLSPTARPAIVVSGWSEGDLQHVTVTGNTFARGTALLEHSGSLHTAVVGNVVYGTRMPPPTTLLRVSGNTVY